MTEMQRVIRPGVTPAEPLVPNAPKWAQARCGLPGCGAALYMERHTGYAINLVDTAEDLRNGTHTESWEVVCENGHRIAVPEGGDENEQFGLCTFEPDEHEPGGVCPCGDLARLRAVIAPEVFEAVPDSPEGLT